MQKEEEEDKELLDLLEGKRKKIQFNNIFFYYFIIIAYTSQSNRRNFINEVIEEEDEDKNNLNKDNEIKKEFNNINRNNDKFRKIITKSNDDFNNIKVINDKNIKEENSGKNKQNLIWSSSPFNKKINTYENLFSKKTFDKYVSIRDKLIPENKNGVVLPNLNKINNSNNHFNNFESLNIKKPFSSQQMNLRSISTDKAKFQQNININSITGDTSAFTHSSKKYFSPGGIGNQNYTEDLSKFRMGLLSAGSTSNNNIIIPMIPIRRPVSNFNFGGGQLWNNFENNNKNLNNKNNTNKANPFDDPKTINNNLKKEEDENIFDFENNKKELNLNNSKKNYNIYNKSNNIARNKTLKSQDKKKPYDNFPIKNDYNNLYLGMDKMITKLHKIKIEKGMMNSGIMNSLNKKFNNDYQNQIEQFKKSHLPMMFNNQNNKINKAISLNDNNNDKNKSTRSHSFNNRNNFY